MLINISRHNKLCALALTLLLTLASRCYPNEFTTTTESTTQIQTINNIQQLETNLTESITEPTETNSYTNTNEIINDTNSNNTNIQIQNQTTNNPTTNPELQTSDSQTTEDNNSEQTSSSTTNSDNNIQKITPILNSKQINPQSILSIDERREYIRLNSWNLSIPIQITINNDSKNKLINISRGGLAVKHNNTLKAGNIIPITIKYRNLNIKTYAQVLYANSNRASCKFINPNKTTSNQLLYLSVLLEADNNILITRFN